ncbi:hypothetical protein VNO80_03236 [Phaseolus coccineus]|uniref:Uncharacterized protein n=1 Tax=Phaseolus coccineus TaxID=3886 RepID=A0AAN9NQY4_PHACN
MEGRQGKSCHGPRKKERLFQDPTVRGEEEHDGVSDKPSSTSFDSRRETANADFVPSVAAFETLLVRSVSVARSEGFRFGMNGSIQWSTLVE